MFSESHALGLRFMLLQIRQVMLSACVLMALLTDEAGFDSFGLTFA
jgi:hypothetical protein